MLNLDTKPTKPTPPLFLPVRSSTFLIISTVSIAVFTDIFLFSLIIPVIPFALETRIGLPPEEAQYAISLLLAAYAAGPIVVSPFIGWIADKVKTRRSCLLVGLVCLVGATLLFCFGRSLGAYIVARLLQGVTSGIVWIVGLALIADTVEEGRIGRAMSIISIQLNLGLALGPMLGGIVYERDGWYGVFALGFALLGLDIVLRLMLIEKHVAARYNPSSYLTADTFVASDGKRKTSATRRSRKLPEVIRLLQYPRMIAGMWLAFAQATIISAFDAVLPLHLNRLFGWTSFQAGLSYLAIAIPPFFVAPLSGWMSDTYGAKYPALAGMTLAIPFLLLLRIPEGEGQPNASQEGLICVFLVFLNVALSLVSAPSISEISYISKEHGNGQLAQAYALFNMAFSAGFLIGPLWGGYVTERAGWQTMVTNLAGFAFLTLVPVLVWTGSPLNCAILCSRHPESMHLSSSAGNDQLFVSNRRNIFYTSLDRRPKRVFDKEAHPKNACQNDRG